MSDRIEYSNIVNPDVDKRLDDLSKKLGKIDQQIDDIAKSKGANIIPSGDGKEAEKINTETKKIKDNIKKTVSLQKERLDVSRKADIIRKQILQTEKEKLKTLAKDAKLSKELIRIQEQEKQKQKEIVREIREKIKGTTEYNAKIRKGEQAAKAEKREKERVAKAQVKIAKQQDRINAKLNKAKTTTNTWGKALDSFAFKFNTLGNLAGGLLLQGVNRVSSGLRSAFGIVVDFEKSMDKVAAVSGATGSEMKELEKLAKDLGSTTEFTASAVAQLELELSKLGFSVKEIKEVTGATLDLATATESELGRSAEVVGNTLRGFGLATSETSRLTDVMAKSFSSSALDMEKFATAMSSVAPVAKNANFSLEETTAMLGILVDRGIDASTAGTALRNIFLKLSEKGLSFEEAMQKINSATDKNAVALDLFGTRGATVSTILAETGLQVDSLTNKLENSEGAASEMAATMRDNLQGDLDTLTSTIQGKFLDAGGSMNGILRGIVKAIISLVRNIDTVLIVLGTYITTMKLSAVVTKNSAAGFKGLSAAFQGFATKIGDFVSKNTIGLVVTSLALLAKHIYDNVTATSKMEEIQDRLNDKLAEQTAELRILEERYKKAKGDTEERNRLIDQLNDNYSELIGRTIEYGASEKQLRVFMNEVNKAFEARIKLQVLEEEYTNVLKERLKLEAQSVHTLEDLASKGSELAKTILATEEGLRRQLEAAREEAENYNIVTDEGNDVKEVSITLTKEQTKELEKEKEALKKLNEELEEAGRLNKKDIQNKTKQSDLQENINKQLESHLFTKEQLSLLDEDIDLVPDIADDADEFEAAVKKYRDNIDKLTGKGEQLQEFEKQLRELFDENFTDDDINFLAQNLQIAGDIFSIFIDTRIQKIDELIAKQDEELSKAQNYYDEQAELADQGLANDLDRARLRLQAEEDDALELERQRADAAQKQKSLAKASLTVDYLAELGKIALYAHANIVANAGTAGGWALGVIAAQSAIATGRYAAALNQLNAQKFADGTESVTGGIKGKDSVNALLMPEERVLTVDQNKPLLKMGVKNDEIPNLVAMGLMNKKLKTKSNDVNYQMMIIDAINRGNNMMENTPIYFINKNGGLSEVYPHKNETNNYN